MTFRQPTITGVLRKWRRLGKGCVSGYVYESDIWDEGEPAYLELGTFIESANYFLFNMGSQVYKLPKEEEVKDDNTT
jgi:hypothetical protein